MFRKTLLATAVVLALASPATALTADEEVAALKQLPWVRAGIYTLPISGSKLALPQGDIAVFGAHAQRANKLLGNPVERSELEAFVVDNTDRDQIQIVTFESNSTGYIGLDDWTQVDPTVTRSGVEPRRKTNNAVSKASPGCTSAAGCNRRHSIATPRPFIGR